MAMNTEGHFTPDSIEPGVQVKTKLNWTYMGLTILICFMDNLPVMQAGDIGAGLARMIVLMLFSFLVAFVLRGRKGEWKSFSKWFFWLTLILLAGTTKH